MISLKPLREFWQRHPEAEGPLRLWYKTPLEATWSSLSDVRQTYAHAGDVITPSGGTLTVFNISGNTYRLVARIRYGYQLINVRAVMTHQKYDEGTWKE